MDLREKFEELVKNLQRRNEENSKLLNKVGELKQQSEIRYWKIVELEKEIERLKSEFIF